MAQGSKPLHQDRRFRWLLGARGISEIGDGIALIALILYVKEVEETGMAVGGLLLARALPTLFGPLTGVLADRMDKRALMIASDIGQALVYGIIALALPAFPFLLVLVAAASVLDTVFTPASRSAVPSIVAKNQLARANAWLGTVRNLQTAAGPIVGGFLVSALGVRAALIADASTFLVSAMCFTQIGRLRYQMPAEEQTFFGGLKEGLAFTRQHALARAIVITLFLGVAFAALDNVALVFLARDTLGASALGFGFLNSAYGLGMIAASAVLIRWSMATSARTLYLLGWLLSGIGTIATGVAPVLLVAVAAQAAAGVGNGWGNVAADTIIQENVPNHMLGRVFGLIATAALLGEGLAYALGGFLLDSSSPRATFLVAGIGVLLVLALTYLLWNRAEESKRSA